MRCPKQMGQHTDTSGNDEYEMETTVFDVFGQSLHPVVSENQLTIVSETPWHVMTWGRFPLRHLHFFVTCVLADRSSKDRETG